MTRISLISTAATAALVAGLTFGAAAQQPDTRDRTIMTFSNAVELPGMRLDAGTYVFRLADTQSRNVIQVLTEDETKVLGQWLYVAAERQEASGDTIVTFRETNSSATPAVQYWFYPGERLGKEFIYPKDQATRLAQRTGVGVMTEDGRVSAQTAGPAPRGTDGQPVPPVESAPVASAPPAPSPAPIQERASAAPTQSEAARTASAVNQQPAPADRPELQGQTAARELPSTASPLALTMLLGFFALAGAAGLRMFRA